MARKTLNRKELRAEAEAAEAEGGAGKKKKKATKKKTTKRTKKADKVVRVKMFWGVFNQSLKRVALYEFSQKKQAQKKASDLSASGKSPHFVQKVKEEINE
ncbi:MAG: hypothetical protein MK179_05500 [Pirellulaceae bacterium]|nr:hypothetical protein [Pirellulaceae bacterium]|tara:strand:+ start:122 stop:424 length:303 start_codon:yes stop_codon:yes gene_type:complete